MDQLPKIVRDRLQAARAGDHPDPDLLAAFAEDSLPEAERQPVLEHLSRCAECREVVMLATNAEESTTAAPVSTARVTVPARERSRIWLQKPFVRWAALAACIGLAATLVIRHEWKGTTPAEANLALTHPESRPAPVPPATQAEVETAQNPSKAQSRTAGLAKQRQTNPVLSASAAQPRAKRSARPTKPAMSAANRHGLTNVPVSESAFSAPSQTAPAPLLAGKGTSTSGSAGGVAPANEQADRKKGIPAMANAVEVEGALPAAPQAQSGSGRRFETQTVDALNEPKPATESAQSAGGVQSGVAGGIVGGAPVTMPPLTLATVPALKDAASTNPVQWTLSAEGVLERSSDSGRTWKKIGVGNGSHFRALSATGTSVWAGGADGLLFHSSDAGAHWTQIHPVANGVALTSTITRIDFTDATHGRLTTTTGDTWLTADAGRTWQKQ